MAEPVFVWKDWSSYFSFPRGKREFPCVRCFWGMICIGVTVVQW